MPQSDARMIDLREQDGRFFFRITGREDFNGAVAALKAAIPYRDRNWDPVTREWDVPATRYSEERLRAIFPNAANALLALKSQMRMF